jgi:hypothetical protein
MMELLELPLLCEELWLLLPNELEMKTHGNKMIKMKAMKSHKIEVLQSFIS